MLVVPVQAGVPPGAWQPGQARPAGRKLPRQNAVSGGRGRFISPAGPMQAPFGTAHARTASSFVPARVRRAEPRVCTDEVPVCGGASAALSPSRRQDLGSRLRLQECRTLVPCTPYSTVLTYVRYCRSSLRPSSIVLLGKAVPMRLKSSHLSVLSNKAASRHLATAVPPLVSEPLDTAFVRFMLRTVTRAFCHSQLAGICT